MKKIISIIKPFILNQEIMVYDGQNKVETIKSAINNNFSKNIVDIAKKYDIKEIELIGSKKYLQKIKKDIITTELDKYNNNNLNIIIIEK